MAFEDDFHLTVIPNFLHDSDAYIANLENKLECLRQVNKSPTPKEMLAAMTQAKALRMKDAELNPELHPKPPDEAANEEEDNGLLALWPSLFMPISRRLFPRLALTKEETLHLLKCDHLNMQYQDEVNNNSSSNGNNTANEGYEIRNADTPPDTSWERRQRDSSAEQPIIVYESPEANELQIPKNWVDDEIHPEHHQGTCAQLDDIVNVRTTANRSALSLSATNSPTAQQPDASTLTSITPSKRSEEAFYHFAYIMTSVTSTQDSARPGSPIEYFNCSKMTVQDHVAFTSTCDMNNRRERFSTLQEHETTFETNGLSNSSANVSVKEQAVVTAQPTTFQNTEDEAECKDTPAEDGNEVAANVQPDDDRHEEHKVTLVADKDDSAAVVEAGDDCGEGKEAEEQMESFSKEDDNKVSEGSETSLTKTGCKDSMTRLQTAQNMILPEVTVASSSSKESVPLEQARREEEKDQGIRARIGEDGSRGADLTIPEYTVASSSTHEGAPVAGVEGPWLFDKESDTSLGKNSGEDVLQRMSSLVRASIDEDDDGTLNVGTNQEGVSGRLSLTGGCSDRTRSKASEGTSGNYTTNYSDPHSNQFEEESVVAKEGGPAPIIRMFGLRGHDIQAALQSNLRTWVQRRGADQSRDYHDEDESPPMPHEDSDIVKRLVPAASESDVPHTEECEYSASTVPRYYQDVKERPRSPRDISRQALRISVSHNARRKAPSARSLAPSDHDSETSATPSPTPTMSQTDGKTVTMQVPWTGGKLSTSSTFKNRQRSVHWFKTVDYVDSRTVVKECDYLPSSRENIKDQSATEAQCTSLKSETSKEAGECDTEETSTTDNNYRQATVVAEKEVCREAVVSVRSLPGFFEASQGEMASVYEVREGLEVTTEGKEENTADYIMEPSKSLESCLEGKEENAADYVMEPSKSLDSCLDSATSPVNEAQLGAIEQEGTPCPNKPQPEAVQEKPKGREETIPSEEGTFAAGPTLPILSSASSVSSIQGTIAPQEDIAAEANDVRQDSTTPDGLPNDEVSTSNETEERDDAQAENFTPMLACTSQAPKPSPRQERKTVELKDAAHEGSTSSSDTLFLHTSRNKRDPSTAVEARSRATPSRDTTVLHCHELVPSGHFSVFPAPNRASVLVHRYVNSARMLRITTTNQFKRLSLQQSITSALSRSSNSLERPLGAQSRQIVLPRGLAPSFKPPERQHRLSIEYKDCATPRRTAVKSASCKNIDEANNTNSSLSELPLAHKSFSVDDAILEEVEGHATTPSPHKSTAKGAAAEPLVADKEHDDVKATSSNDSQETKSEVSAVTKESITMVDEPSEVQLPPKKRKKLRISGNATEAMSNQNDPSKQSPGELSMSPQCVDECTEDTATANAEIVKAEGCEEAIVDEVSMLQRTEFSDLLEGDDKSFGNREYLVQGGQCDGTISLIPESTSIIPESQYSTISAGVEESHIASPSVVAPSNANVGSIDLCDYSLPSACECVIQTEPKYNLLPNVSASNVSTDCRLSITDGGKNAGADVKRSTAAVTKPPTPKRRRRGGEKDVSDTAGSTSTSTTSVLSETSATTEDSSSQLQIFSDVNKIFASESQSETSYGL